MFGSSTQRVRELFEAQFEPDGQGFVYRKHSKGVPRSVTAEERAAFIRSFVRYARFGSWGLMFATMAMIVLLALLVGATDAPNADLAMYGGMSVLLAVFMMGFYWVWNEPARALQRRPAIGNALSAEEARALNFSRISYANLALAFFFGAGVIVTHLDETEGWGVLWIAGGTAFIGLSVVQAVRKWMHERR